LQRLQAKKLASIAVIIGPEGDLTPNEIEQALAAGALPVSFGELTLRVETAAIYAASVLAYEFLWQ
jgi:16S rRNA (uracil1498-N3)-methyltransferase